MPPHRRRRRVCGGVASRSPRTVGRPRAPRRFAGACAWVPVRGPGPASACALGGQACRRRSGSPPEPTRGRCPCANPTLVIDTTVSRVRWTSMAASTDARTRLETLLAERIVILDGAWGVLLQGRGLTEEEFRGEPFRDHPRDVKGDPDLLNLTRPEVVSSVHGAYLDAGADITTTNTFTATSIGQGDYGLQDAVYDMNVAGARLAKKVAARFADRFVAGSVGPLNVTLSLSPKVEDASFRKVTFDQVYEAYAEQIRGLRDGGVDLLLIETIFDTLNAKAAIAAAKDAAPELPVWISVTIVDRSGRTLSGQTIEAFWTSVEHAMPAIVGVNCSLGASEMRPHIEGLARVAPIPVACYPNAGLPNAFGGYDETPDTTSGLLGGFARDGLVNIVGGCCGTTPEHIRAIVAAVHDPPPREVPSIDDDIPTFSGLEPFAIRSDTGFVMIGE